MISFSHIEKTCINIFSDFGYVKNLKGKIYLKLIVGASLGASFALWLTITAVEDLNNDVDRPMGVVILGDLLFLAILQVCFPAR